MRTPIEAILATTFCLFAAVFSGDGSTKRIAVLVPTDESFDRVLKSGIRQELNKKNQERSEVNLEAIWLPPTSNTGRQIGEVADLIKRQKIDAIALHPASLDAMNGVSTLAAQQHIEVAVIGPDRSAAASPRCLAVIGMDNVARGRRVMHELITGLEALSLDRSSIAIFGGDPAYDDLRKRVDGAMQEAQAEKITLDRAKDVVYGQEIGAIDQIRNTWYARPNLSGWAMVSGWEIFSQKGAFNWAPKSVFVVVYDDFIDNELEYVSKEFIQVLLVDDWHAWGAKALDVIYDKIVDGTTPETQEGFIEIGPQKVTSNNKEEFARDWHRWAQE